MRLWTISYRDDDAPSGQRTEWFASQPAALLRQWEIGVPAADPEQVEVPIRRAALAYWLTRYEP